MSFIPTQPIELNLTVIFSDDARMRVTMFPLASHGREHPLDLLEGFVNGRRGEFFPLRTPDKKEMLVPLSEVYVFELSHTDEHAALERYPEMHQMCLQRQGGAVACYAMVALTLSNGRTVRGSVWFHDYVPENMRNLLDFLNEERRYLLIHSEKYSQLVRVDSIIRAQIFTPESAGDSSNVKDLPQTAQYDSRLVDTEVGFAPATAHHGMEAHIEGSAAEHSGDDFLMPEEVDARNLERVAKTQIFPRPDFGKKD